MLSLWFREELVRVAKELKHKMSYSGRVKTLYTKTPSKMGLSTLFYYQSLFK